MIDLSEMYFECLVQINEEQVFQRIAKQLNPKLRIKSTKNKVAKLLQTMKPEYHLS